MSKNVDLKRAKILEVAKRRFSHFGMAKTTMAEIAKDLSFSKALLYYYYPDKNSLYMAVLDYVVNDMIARIDHFINQTNDVEEAMLFTIQTRMEIIMENYNLFEYSMSLFKDMCSDTMENVRGYFEKEKQQFIRVFEIGVKSGQIVVDNRDECANLLMFSLIGTRLGIMKDLKSSIFPSKEEFDYILNMQNKMVHIFIRGLRP